MLFAPLALFGELLIAKTHHRPLGAAVFAVASVVAWGGAEVISRRALNPSFSTTRARARQVVWALSILFAIGVCARALL